VGNDCFFYLLGNVPKTIAFFYFLFFLKQRKLFLYFTFTTFATEYTLLKRNRQVKNRVKGISGTRRAVTPRVFFRRRSGGGEARINRRAHRGKDKGQRLKEKGLLGLDSI